MTWLYNSSCCIHSDGSRWVSGVSTKEKKKPFSLQFISKYPDYRTTQNFDQENIDEFDEFLAIRQYFPYQNFPFR